MESSILAAYIISVFLLVATPGPVVALVINTSLNRGVKQAFLTVLGTNGASLILIATAVCVITGVMTINQDLISWLSLLGCLFIAYIATDSLRDVAQSSKEKVDQGRTREVSERNFSARCFTKGFAVGISNPKDIIFFVAFFPQFISITNSFSSSVTVLTILWVTIDLSILSLYIFFMQHRLVRNYQQAIAFLSSIALLAIAAIGFIYTISEW
ncbi:LysE family translocator [Halomonas sp. WWR20]